MCFIQYCMVGLMLVLALVIGKSWLVCKTVPSVAVNEKALMEIKGAMFQPHKSLFQSYVQILAVWGLWFRNQSKDETKPSFAQRALLVTGAD